MTPQGQNGLHKGALEFAALGLWALAVYTVLSLASHDIGREPNLGGPLGGALARTLERAFGHVASAGVRCQRHGAYIVAGFATVIVPDGARCRINSALTDSKSDCVGIASDAGATLDFSGLVGGGTALTLSISPMVPIQVISRGLRTLR
jgi:hypothetical protein